MSDRGIRGFYLITKTIEEQLLDDANVNTVTTGDITKVDLSKQTIFPLSHIVINQSTIEEQVIRFNISVLSMDVVDMNKEEVTDIFRGNDNEQDILNTQLAVLNKLTQVLGRGTLYIDKYQLDGTVSCEPFYDRFENEMAGWAATFDILIPNDITIC